jgi:hypothetical protein
VPYRGTTGIRALQDELGSMRPSRYSCREGQAGRGVSSSNWSPRAGRSPLCRGFYSRRRGRLAGRRRARLQAGRGVLGRTPGAPRAGRSVRQGAWPSTFAGAILGEFPRTASCGSCGRSSGFPLIARGGGPVGGGPHVTTPTARGRSSPVLARWASPWRPASSQEVGCSFEGCGCDLSVISPASQTDTDNTH